MSVYLDTDKRWRYRKMGHYNTGKPHRCSGTAPKHDNTKRAAELAEAAHLLRVASMPPPAESATAGEDQNEGGTTEQTPTAPAPTVATMPVVTAPQAPTLGVFLPTYLATTRLDVADSTYESKASIAAQYLQTAMIGDVRLADLRLDQISAAVIDAYRKVLAVTRNTRIKCRVQPINPKTANNVLTVLGHVLETARYLGLIEDRPEIRRLKVEDPDWDFLTFDEADALLAAAEGVWRTMILVGLRTGLRRGELRGLLWADVDLERGVLNLKHNFVRDRMKKPKSGKARVIELSKAAREALALHRASARHEYVFCDDQGMPFTTGLMQSRLDRMCRLAGLRLIGWHVLRHTFATHLVRRGVHMREVQELMGHSSMLVTQRYAHVMAGARHEAVGLLDGPTGAQGKPTPSTASPAVGASVDRRSGKRPAPSSDAPALPGVGRRTKTAREMRRERFEGGRKAGSLAKDWQETVPEALSN